MQQIAVTGISGILSLWSILAAKILLFFKQRISLGRFCEKREIICQEEDTLVSTLCLSTLYNPLVESDENDLSSLPRHNLRCSSVPIARAAGECIVPSRTPDCGLTALSGVIEISPLRGERAKGCTVPSPA